jgi:hypothetical protein
MSFEYKANMTSASNRIISPNYRQNHISKYHDVKEFFTPLHIQACLLPLVLEEAEDGFEMERVDKSSIAFFTGLSLISSPGKHVKRGLKIPPFFV